MKDSLKLMLTDLTAEHAEILVIQKNKKLAKLRFGLGDSKIVPIINNTQHDPKALLDQQDPLV